MSRHDLCPIGEEHRRFVRAPAHEQAAAHLSDLCLYHWAPRARRAGIIRFGLMPGKNAVGREWKPPYVCFADNPDLAWSLSGAIHPEIEEWDLWMVYPSRESFPNGWEIIFDTYPGSGRHYIKEYRVYYRVFKRYVGYIASRTHKESVT